MRVQPQEGLGGIAREWSSTRSHRYLHRDENFREREETEVLKSPALNVGTSKPAPKFPLSASSFGQSQDREQFRFSDELGLYLVIHESLLPLLHQISFLALRPFEGFSCG